MKKTFHSLFTLHLALVATALLVTSVAAQQAAPTPYPVTVQTNVRVRMRDGVSLVADIYRPKAEGKFPVLLTRTPYNRKDPATGTYLAAHGYVTILQDTRGRFDSEGEFYPFRYEAQDGFDTIEWAAALPYADGRVGTRMSAPRRCWRPRPIRRI
jgi:predicted acyl esterase